MLRRVQWNQVMLGPSRKSQIFCNEDMQKCCNWKKLRIKWVKIWIPSNGAIQGISIHPSKLYSHCSHHSKPAKHNILFFVFLWSYFFKFVRFNYEFYFCFELWTCYRIPLPWCMDNVWIGFFPPFHFSLGEHMTKCFNFWKSYNKNLFIRSTHYR
jgi:hypothetical protein